MSQYVRETAESLNRVLQHAAGLHAHRLAGYAANLDFWVGEICHCLAVIDGYDIRFDRLKKATKEYSKIHHAGRDPAANVYELMEEAPPKKEAMTRVTRSISVQELSELRIAVEDTSTTLLKRCRKEGFLSKSDYESHLRNVTVKQ